MLLLFLSCNPSSIQHSASSKQTALIKPTEPVPAFYKWRGALGKDTVHAYLYTNLVAADYFVGFIVNEQTGHPTEIWGRKTRSIDLVSEKLWGAKSTTDALESITFSMKDSLNFMGSIDALNSFKGLWENPNLEEYIPTHYPLFLQNVTLQQPRLNPIGLQVSKQSAARLMNGKPQYDMTINTFKLNQAFDTMMYHQLYGISLASSKPLTPVMTQQEWSDASRAYSYPQIAFLNQRFISGCIVNYWLDEQKSYQTMIPFIYDIERHRKLTWQDIASPENQNQIRDYLIKTQSEYSDTPLTLQTPFITHKGFVWIHYPERDSKQLERSKLAYIPFSEIAQWLYPDFLQQLKD